MGILDADQQSLFDQPSADQPATVAGTLDVAVFHVRDDVSKGLARSRGGAYSFGIPRGPWAGSGMRLGVFFGVDTRRSIAFGLAIVHPRTTRSDADRTIEATHFTTIKEMDCSDADEGAKAAAQVDGPITTTLGAKLLDAIAESSSTASDVIEHLAAKLAEIDDSDDGSRLRDERDAILLLTRFAHMTDLPMRAWSRPKESAPFLAGLPHDRAAANSHRRHGLAWLDEASIDWPQGTEWLFRQPTADDRSSLLIANAVPDPIKARERGRIELVYYHLASGTLVQCSYVRTLAGSASEPVLDRQAMEDLLIEYPPPTDRRLDAADLQFVRSSRFVKITTSDPLELANMRLTSGRIYPVDFVRPFLEASLQGTAVDAASVSVTLPFPRYLTNTQFTSLVWSGWLGRRAIRHDDVVRVVRHCLNSTGSLVLGFDFSPRELPGNG